MPNSSLVRAAGALYAIIIICGLTAELLLRGPALASLATSTDQPPVTASAALRLSLLADLVMLLADIALALVFFRLLRPVSEGLALAAMVLRLGQALLIANSLTALAAAPALLAEGATTEALRMAALHATGYDVGLILFGANSLLMALLLCRAGGVPHTLVAGIALSGLVYVAGSLVHLLDPAHSPLIAPAYLLPMLAETALCLWLLVAARLRPPSVYAQER
jgi:hypothetical protein